MQEATATYTFPEKQFTKNLSIIGVEGDATKAVFSAADVQRRWYTGSNSTTLYIAWLTFQNITAAGAGTYRNMISSTKLTVTDCIFKDITQPGSAGTTGNGGIVGTEYQGAALDLDITIKNNLFYNLLGGSPTLMIALHAGGGADYGDVRWYNNTIYADGSYTTPSLFVINSLASTDYDMRNNIFYNTASTSFLASGSALDGIFNYNSTYNCTGVPTGTGNITSDPLFVDAANDNFALRPTSPCIDTGEIL